jgi:hypothetical protein
VGVVADSERSGVLTIPGHALAAPIAATLAAVADGPVVVEKDTPAPRRPRSLIELRAKVIDGYFGSPATLKELDLVAITKARPLRTIARCGPYRSEMSGRPISWTASGGDEEVAVYERRTGRVVARRVFGASYDCPTFYTATVGYETMGRSDTKNEKAHAQAHRWLAGLVKQ